MPDPQPRSRSFPLTQRELVGLALQRGARRPAADASAGPAPHHTQRDRVRLALALGLGASKGARPARRGIYR